MPLPIMTFQQGNPYIRGAGLGQKLFEQGVNNAFLPQTLGEELRKLMIANAMAEPKVKFAGPLAQAELEQAQALPGLTRAQALLAGEQGKYYGPNVLSEISERRARIPLHEADAALKKFQVQNPLLSQTGTAGQVGSLLYLQQHPDLTRNSVNQLTQEPRIPFKRELQNLSVNPSPLGGEGAQSQNLSNILQEGIFSDLLKKKALTDLANVRAQGYAWSNMPSPYKQYNLAQAKALGYSYDEASKLFNQGYSMDQLAKAKNIDPNNMPLPEFAPTNMVLTQYERSQVALAELDAVEPQVSNAVAPYAQRFRGYSLPQIADALKGSNIDEQARYLAAAALQPELAALRIRAAQGQAGITAINETIAAAQNNIRTLQPTLRPEVYKKMNKYINDWLHQMNRAGRKALTSYEREAQEIENLEISQTSTMDDAAILNALMEGS